VRLDDDKIGQMGFRTRPNHQDRAIRKAEAEKHSNDSAIWVTSPWKPSYLGYIGLSFLTDELIDGLDGPLVSVSEVGPLLFQRFGKLLKCLWANADKKENEAGRLKHRMRQCNPPGKTLGPGRPPETTGRPR
jgi:hypothetical protein